MVGCTVKMIRGIGSPLAGNKFLLSWIYVISCLVSFQYPCSSFPSTTSRGRAYCFSGRNCKPEEHDVTKGVAVRKPQEQSQSMRLSLASMPTVSGPSVESKPDYENVHGPLGKLCDKIFLTIFRSKLAEKVGVDSDLPQDDYSGLIDLTSLLNSRSSDRLEIQIVAQEVLKSLFPSWLPGRYAVMFSKPFPEFSSRMNAWATKVGGTWLMGECEINDCEIDDGKIGVKQGLLVKRCRFLEESGCASVCVNSCKIPTQRFFMDNMGLPLTMTPDYETFECQFSFGLTPTSTDDTAAMLTPCLARCPSAGRMRTRHDNSEEKSKADSICSLMDIDRYKS